MALVLALLWSGPAAASGSGPEEAMLGSATGLLAVRFGGHGAWPTVRNGGSAGGNWRIGLDPETAAAAPAGPDWRGLWRDTAYFVGYQFVGIAFLYALPESITNWSQEDKEQYGFSDWRENATHPRWDPDDWWLNYVLHPYWGAAYFVRGQERGLDDAAAFLYSTLLSSLYEFGAEALFEQPSIQDLVVTPILGSLVGRVFMSVRETVQRRTDTPQPGDTLILVLTDPLGAINRLVDDLFGVNAQLTIGLSTGTTLGHADEHPADYERIAMRHAAAAQHAVWALELRVSW